MTFDVIVAPKPFTPRVERMAVEEGRTVGQILLQACQDELLDPQDLPRTEVYIDGLRIADRKLALAVVPVAGELVNIVVQPQGGGSGHGKNPLEVALQIAVMAAAFVVTGPAGPLAGALAGAGITGMAASAISIAAAGAINIAGDFALSAMFHTNSTDTTTQYYSLDAQSNQARLRKSMPLCLGQRRWSLDVAATAFTTIDGNDVYLTVMYGAHYGPCAMADIKIGETMLSAYPTTDYEIEYFLTPGPRVSKLYPSQVDQQSFQNNLDPLTATWTPETSGLSATSLSLDLYWPQLYYTSSGGVEENQDSVVYMEYSVYGANNWLPVPGYPAGKDADGNAYPAGSYYISGNTHNPTRRTVTWAVPEGQYDVRLGRRIRRGGDTSRSVDDVYWTALRSLNSSKPAIADENLALIVLKVLGCQDFDGTLGVVSAVVTPIAPIYDATSETWPGDPTTYDAVHWQPTSNAAALARYVMTGYPATLPLAAAEIDASFGTQYALIEAMNWHGGLLQADDTSQSDTLVALGKLGRCYFYWNGQALCCVPDYEKPAPRQMFTGRNASNYKYKRVFPDPVHAVFVDFTNADEDYKEDGIYVYNDGFTAANASLFEGLTLDYACTLDRAQREGRVYLAKRKLYVETHEWTAGIDAVASTFGDRVVVRHISTLYGIGEARVQFRRWSGALIAGVRLDTEVTFKAGQAYAADVRRADQVLRSIPLTTSAGTTRDLVFAAPLIVAQAPEKGDLVVIGLTTSVTEDVELMDVQPQPDGSVQLMAMRYAGAEIVAAETGAIAPLQSQLTARVAAPVPTILGSTGDPSGVTVAFDISAQRQVTISGFTARYRRSPSQDASAGWNTLPSLGPAARTVTTPAILNGQVLPGGADAPYSLDVEIRTILTTGEVSQPAQALSIVVTKGVYAPLGFAAAGQVRTASDGSSYPVIAITADAVTAGSTQDLVIELQPTASNPAAWKASASGPFHGDNPNGDLTDVLSGDAYDVRARWRTSDNWYSDYVTITNVAVPSGALVSSGMASLIPLPATVEAQGEAQIQAAIDASGETAARIFGTTTSDGTPVRTVSEDSAEAISLLGNYANGKFILSDSTLYTSAGLNVTQTLTLLQSTVNGTGGNPSLFAQVATLANATTDTTNGNSLASQIATVRAGYQGAYGDLSASITNLTKATTDQTTGTSLASLLTALTATVGTAPAADGTGGSGLQATVTEAAAVAARADGRTQAYFSVDVDAGTGNASLTISSDGVTGKFLLVGDVEIDGSLVVRIPTGSLAQFAATKTMAFEPPTNVGLGAPGSAAVLIGQETFDCSGAPLRVDVVVRALNTDGTHEAVAELTLQRDGAEISDPFDIWVRANTGSISGGQPGSTTTSFLDQAPTAGNHTYSVYARMTTGSGNANQLTFVVCRIMFIEFRDNLGASS